MGTRTINCNAQSYVCLSMGMLRMGSQVTCCTLDSGHPRVAILTLGIQILCINDHPPDIDDTIKPHYFRTIHGRPQYPHMCPSCKMKAAPNYICSSCMICSMVKSIQAYYLMVGQKCFLLNVLTCAMFKSLWCSITLAGGKGFPHLKKTHPHYMKGSITPYHHDKPKQNTLIDSLTNKHFYIQYQCVYIYICILYSAIHNSNDYPNVMLNYDKTINSNYSNNHVNPKQTYRIAIFSTRV